MEKKFEEALRRDTRTQSHIERTIKGWAKKNGIPDIKESISESLKSKGNGPRDPMLARNIREDVSATPIGPERVIEAKNPVSSSNNEAPSWRNVEI